MNFDTHVSLIDKHTFHFNLRTAFYYQWNDADKLPQLLQKIRSFDKVYWIGGGSNTIFMNDFDGLLIQIATKGIQIRKENKRVFVCAAAGEVWHDFVTFCVEHHLYGLENLALIPGTVGASPVQNIGAYGVEVSDCIHRVSGIDLITCQPFEFSQKECLFSYRNSIFKTRGHFLITQVEFELSEHFTPKIAYEVLARRFAHNPPQSAQSVLDAVIEIRSHKLPNPNIIGNAGSFFHNPIVTHSQAQSLLIRHPNLPHYPQKNGMVKLAAGWLIEQAGGKNIRCHDAAVYEKQALVLINNGKATPQDLQHLIEKIQQAVKIKFDIDLMIEPNLLL